MKLLFKPDLSYKNKILKFLETVLGPEHVILNESLFDWFYLENVSSYKEKDKLSFILALDNGEITSLLGFYEVRVSINGENMLGVWAALWFTNPKFKSGIGGFLMKKLMDEYKFVAALACSEENQKIAKVLGFNILSGLESYVFILNKNKMENLSKIKLNNSKRFINAKNKKNGLFKIKSFSTSLMQIKVIDNSIVKLQGYLGTVKDQNYLDWRYNNHPFFEYNWTYIENKGIINAWLIWRIAKVNEAKLCRIVDFDCICSLENEEENIILLIDELVDEMEKRGINYIDLYTTNNSLIGYLTRFGFISNSDMLLPSLIDPVTDTCPIVTGEYYIKDAKKYGVLNFSCFRGDGDIDRPNKSMQLKKN